MSVIERLFYILPACMPHSVHAHIGFNLMNICMHGP
jgi:hypothetical protein